MLNLKNYCVNPFQENTYILWDETQEGVITDPGCLSEEEVGRITQFIEDQHIDIKAIWLTHGHFDHIYGVSRLSRKYGVPAWMSPADQAIMDRFSDHARSFGMPAPDLDFQTVPIGLGNQGQPDRPEEIGFGHSRFQVIPTPGHSPGGLCFYDQEDKVLLCGDTLFAGAIGRSDLYMGDYDQLIVSVMEKVMGIDGDVRVYPGHGPSTDIGYERTHNPFLQPFNEKEEIDWEQDGLEIHG